MLQVATCNSYKIPFFQELGFESVTSKQDEDSTTRNERESTDDKIKLPQAPRPFNSNEHNKIGNTVKFPEDDKKPKLQNKSSHQ